MEKSKKSTLTSAVKGLNKALFHTVGYYCDGMQKFVAASAGKCNINLQAASQFKPLILIVARRHYTELNRSYPLENRNEVKKLILLEYAEQRVYYKLGKAENGRIVANIWLFKGRVPASLLTVPESFILAARSTLGSILQINTQPKQFITAQNQLVHSQTSNQLITNANTFAMSVGMPSSFELDQIEADILPAVLVENLKNVTISGFALFFNTPKLKLTKHGLNKILTPSFVLGVLYLVLSSVYVAGYKSHLESQISQQNEDIDRALDANSQMQQQVETYQKLQKFMSTQPDVAAVWYVFADVASDVQLSRFELVQGRFVLAGQTERATNLLEKISKNPHVQEARFDNPTRTSNNQEYFVVSFTVKPLQEKEITQRVADASI